MFVRVYVIHEKRGFTMTVGAFTRTGALRKAYKQFMKTRTNVTFKEFKKRCMVYVI